MFVEVFLEYPLAWNIPMLVSLIAVAIIYVRLLNRFTTIKIYHKQPLLLFFSLCLFYLTIGSPLSAISHLSFSLHMIQMSILFFIVPPIFLLGIPSALDKKIRTTQRIAILNKWRLAPKISLVFFAILFFMYHLPVTLTLFSQSSFIHHGYIFLLLLLSISMWWPIVAPNRKERLYNKQKKRYAFLSGALLMPACLLLIVSAFIEQVTNPFLTEALFALCIPPDLFSLDLLPTPFNTKYDQVMAGFFMLGIHKISLMVTTRLDSAEDAGEG